MPCLSSRGAAWKLAFRMSSSYTMCELHWRCPSVPHVSRLPRKSWVYGNRASCTYLTNNPLAQILAGRALFRELYQETLLGPRLSVTLTVRPPRHTAQELACMVEVGFSLLACASPGCAAC